MDLLQSILEQTADLDPPPLTTPKPSTETEHFAAMVKGNNDTNAMLQQVIQQMAENNTTTSQSTNAPRNNRNRRAQQGRRGGPTPTAPVQAGRGEMAWRKVTPGPGEPHKKRTMEWNMSVVGLVC